MADNMPAKEESAFIHRQTMANAVRYSTIELGDLEGRIARAADQAATVAGSIVTAGFLADPASRVTASSQRSVDGTIEVQALNNLNSVSTPLPLRFAPAAALLPSRCAERLDGETGSFALSGRDGAPVAPDDTWPSLLLLSHGPKTQHSRSSQDASARLSLLAVDLACSN